MASRGKLKLDPRPLCVQSAELTQLRIPCIGKPTMRKSSECLAEANLRLLTAPPHTSFLFLCFFLFPASRSFSCAAYVKGEASVRFKHQTALQHQRRSKGIQSHTPLTTVGQVIFKKNSLGQAALWLLSLSRTVSI